MKTQNLQLYYFNTPKRQFHKFVKNFQEAMQVFLSEAGTYGVIDGLKNNYGFKQVENKRFNH